MNLHEQMEQVARTIEECHQNRMTAQAVRIMAQKVADLALRLERACAMMTETGHYDEVDRIRAVLQDCGYIATRPAKPGPCPQCGGDGYVGSAARTSRCSYCVGTGTVWGGAPLHE